ncbi:MAG: pteridine reductase [Gammaproteobacteria bacterium]|nr:pteridine reductase [Gammaproteobacteria bacterium]
MQNNTDNPKVVLITGAAHRVGAAVAEALHAEGFNLVLHYRLSKDAAQTLQAKLNTVRENSVTLIAGDLLDTAKLPRLVQQAIDVWGRLDVLINNASSFYPTPVGEVTEAQWDDLMGSNLKAPFFLAQAAAPTLAAHHGCIVNMADIHAERPLKAYPVYSAAKAGLVMLTKALARELGPSVRVNAVAPGPVFWPDNMDEETKQHIKSRTALKRAGHPSDVARTILFLIRDAGYITGQVIAVDGGRSIYS